MRCSNDQSTSLYHHPSCHKNYTAVKRPKLLTPIDEEPPAKKVSIETRRSSLLPPCDHQGLLRGTCIFCGNSRKKKNGREEQRVKILTVSGCETLVQRAKLSNNERIRSLIRTGVDLIAKEAEYHKSCRMQFLKKLKKTEDSNEPNDKSSPLSFHTRAFESVIDYIKKEVLMRKHSILVSNLLSMYKEEYTSLSGEAEDIQDYSSRNLVRKLKIQFKDEIVVKVLDKRKGNFIFSSTIQEDEAKARLHDDAERYEEDSKLAWAALHLRSVILQLPKTKTPDPVTVENLKKNAPEIPTQLENFFRTLLGGMKPNDDDIIGRKAISMASDAMYNVSKGKVKPWKHTAMGLGLTSLTGSKIAIQIINRTGHSINYSEAKALETEFAYSLEDNERDAPDGICLDQHFATACVWDNNDASVETIDGKETLHATVGHTYQNIDENYQNDTTVVQFREARNRRKFIGREREIPPFRQNIKTAKFDVPEDSEVENEYNIQQAPLDLYWFHKLKEGNTPLYAGFMSRYIKDLLPLQRICYMDPIPKSPTNNDVVRETMVRTLNVAKETGQDYTVVTYDLAIALKAYSIQALEAPLFDKLLIMLGNFHIELAFYGAVGTFIDESGIEFVLTEADVLAEGSMMGFVKGKFYNRCTRIHEILANVLEQKLYDRFLSKISEEDRDALHQVMSTVPLDPASAKEHLADPVVMHHLEQYEEYFQSFLKGNHGATARFWALYIFMINRLHRELQRCVKTNDVSSYIQVLPLLLNVFFALNRPNYARWGTLFLQKLKSANPKLREGLEAGAFSI